MEDYNARYYNFIYDQIKDLKFYYSDLYKAMVDTSTHYDIHPVDLKEFKQAFDWCVADVFNGGCEVEIK